MNSQTQSSPPRHRGRLRKRPQRPPLSIEQILQWADAHFAAREAWPNVNSGHIPGTIDDTWMRMDNSLREGTRGLPKNTKLTLARLLQKRRGVRNSEFPPLLTEKQIIQWTKLHRQRTGKWPKVISGPILGAAPETWSAIDLALRKGKRRGLPGGDSLAQLLHRCCGVPFDHRPAKQLPRLTIRQILAWASDFVSQHGHRPNDNSGPVKQVPGESWRAIDKALTLGRRGLPGASSLAKLFDKHRPDWHSGRGLWITNVVPRLELRHILAWADDYYSRHKRAPMRTSGVIGNSSETWNRVDGALKRGARGLLGRSSLRQLLDEHRPQWRRNKNSRRTNRIAANQPQGS